jgi:hypothetical protein
MSMPHRSNVDFIVFCVRSQPFDKDYLVFVINGDNQAIIVPFDVEHNPVITDDARVSITSDDFRRGTPFGPVGFVKPRVQGRFNRLMVFAAS